MKQTGSGFNFSFEKRQRQMKSNFGSLRKTFRVSKRHRNNSDDETTLANGANVAMLLVFVIILCLLEPQSVQLKLYISISLVVPPNKLKLQVVVKK